MRRRLLALAAVACGATAGLLGPHAVRGGETRPPLRADGTRALVFFNSLCIGCREQAPEVAAWLDRHADLPVLGISYMEKQKDGAEFARKVSWRFDVVGDPRGRIGRRYQVERLDTILVVRRGRILQRYLPPAGS
jgi:peroxiredoxin